MEYKKQYNTNWRKFKFRFFLKKLEAICLFIPKSIMPSDLTNLYLTLQNEASQKKLKYH